MAGRSPVRFLAPLALVAVAFALFSILGGGDGGGEEPATTQQPSATATATPKKAAKPQGKQQRRSGNPAKRQEPAVEAPQGSAFGKPKAEGAFGELSGPDQAALQRMLGNG